MLHLILHFIVPAVVAFLFYPSHWKHATIVMVATMLIDLDHLLADPIYNPERCSIGFHPLHTMPAIIFYGFLFLVPLAFTKKKIMSGQRSLVSIIHLLGLGLLIHIALDWIDCVW